MTRYKRRTFAEIEAHAYAQGWSEGREQARKEFEESYRILSRHDTSLLMEVEFLREQLAHVSLRKLAWSRIKGLFKRES